MPGTTGNQLLSEENLASQNFLAEKNAIFFATYLINIFMILAWAGWINIYFLQLYSPGLLL